MRAHWWVGRSALGAVLVATWVGACTSTSGTDSSSSSGDPGSSSGNSSGQASSGQSSSGASSGSSGASSSSSGQSSGTILRPADPYAPNNPDRDSDCDGLTDEEEFSQTYAGGVKTDPANPDSDGDGIFDGVEAGRTEVVTADAAACGVYSGDLDTTTTTSPVHADTDGDGIPDGIEDANHNGRVDPGETDPNNTDSDGDGLPDGLEDKDHNGHVDAGETDPTARDTDGDGIPDGIEDRNRDGIRQPTETDPTNPDTDGDGLLDGAEDLNWNGTVDAGETDPLVADSDTDGDGIPDFREVQLGYDPNNPDMDADGLLDGQEDRNANGIIDATETNPRRADSDCDGLKDGEEDANHNGTLDAGETDPRARDTDGDLLPDGVERGVTTNPDPTNCPGFTADADPATTTDPRRADTDSDHLNDGIEDRDRNGRVDAGETDPNNPDMDNDGLLDGEEDINGNGVVDPGETDPFVSDLDTDMDGLTDAQEGILGTSPTNPDTDGDGIPDGIEDRNRDAQHGLDETDPLSVDSDCDGVADGEEDANHNGTREPTELDPLNPDTDADGLWDGVELGRLANLDTIKCTTFVGSAAPATITDPLNADTDMDGILDGTEDANQNGRVDTGELNPNVQDAMGSDVQACAVQNLRQVQIITRPGQKADLVLALSPEFTGVTEITVAGEQRGAMVLNPTAEVAGFAFKITPGLTGADVNAQLATLEGRLNAAGSQQDKRARVITRWDGFPAVLSQYQYSDNGNENVAKAANDLMHALLDNSATGALPTNTVSEQGPFRLKLELVRRSAQTTMVVGALTKMSEADSDDQRLFRLDDVTNGSPLAQFGDVTGVQCDRLTVQPRQPVDFLWVVDNSGSMDNEQNALTAATAALTAQLASSTVDWRVALITSDADTIDSDVTDWQPWDYSPPGQNSTTPKFCNFFTEANVSNFTTCVDNVTINGSGTENFFRPVACVAARSVLGKTHCSRPVGGASEADSNMDGKPDGYANGYSPPPAGYDLLVRAAAGVVDPRKLRSNARLVVLFLTDASEQSDGAFTGANPNALAYATITDWANFFKNFDGAGTALSRAFVGGIVCPAGTNCSDGTTNERFPRFFAEMQGVFADLPADGSMNQAGRIQSAISDILSAAVGNASPYVLAKPPISSTIKVATEATTVGACNTADVPRSKTHGWDYEPNNRSIVFYGNCRPAPGQEGQRISVSYRYWTDLSPNADGQPEPCGGCAPPLVCNPVTNMCQCPADCGLQAGCAAPTVCDTRASACTCACPADCGGSPSDPRFVCNTTSCQFECPADCGAASPGPQFACNTTTCQFECSACPGTRPGNQWTCDLASCQWTCPADCGGASPGPGYRCNPASCTYECAGDCGGTCTGNQQCNAGTCNCICQQNVTCGAGRLFDVNACACVCDTAGLNCGPGATPNANSCSCVCQPNCGGSCAANEQCIQSLCECASFGG